MSRSDDPTAEVTDLLQLLIRNHCVNDGTVASGEETRSVDLLAGYLAGAGDHEIYEPQPGRQSLVVKLEGTDPDAPTLMLMGHTDVVPVNPDGWSRDPFGGRRRRRLRVGARRGRHAQPHRVAGGRLPPPRRQRVPAPRHADLLRGRRRGGPRPVGRRLAARPRARRGLRRLRAHRVRRLPDPVAGGPSPPGARGGEGHVLDQDPGPRHARARLAAVPHRQRARSPRPRSSAASPSSAPRPRSTSRGATSSRACTSIPRSPGRS